MNKNGKEFLIWFGIVLVTVFVIYFIVKLIDAITHPSLVWFIIGLATTLVLEGIGWCIYWLKFRTWRFWR